VSRSSRPEHPPDLEGVTRKAGGEQAVSRDQK